jgi:hypothetical protein
VHPVEPAGWVQQLIDPILILVNARTAGQVSHRDVEVGLLQDKWRALGIHIDHVNFELEKEDAPLSWHLMPKQKQNITDAWATSDGVKAARARVKQFLDECPPGQKESAMIGMTTEAGSSV